MVVGVPKDRPTVGDPGLTLTEAQSHFSLWCMAQAVLVATNDVRLRDENIERILLNPETIAVNQDPWSVPAARVPAPGRTGDQHQKPAHAGPRVLLGAQANYALHAFFQCKLHIFLICITPEEI